MKLMISSEQEIFFPPEIVGEKSFISTYSTVGRDVGLKHPAFYCVWALWARYFSLPLRETLRDTASSSSATEIVGDPFEAKSVRRQTKLLFVCAQDKTRKQNRFSHSCVTFSSTSVTNHAMQLECGRSYVSV
jgi:hypothetical protein